MTRRLPVVDGDDGTWGDWLNGFLLKEHVDATPGTPDVTSGGHKTITVQAGTTAAGTAPLKFTSGPLMTAAEAGAVEFLTDTLYITQTTATTRKKIAAYDDTSGATGDIYYRDSSGYFTRLAIGSGSNVLKVNTGIPAWGDVTDANLSTSDITTNDASTSKHGFVPKAVAPTAGLRNVVAIDNAETAYTNKALFDATAPSTQAYGDAADVGTAMVAARRDHKHAMPASTKDTTAVTGVLKGNGSTVSAATAGTDYAVGSTGLSGGQTIAGGTLTTQNLSLRPNAADLTTGAVATLGTLEATNSTTGSVTVAGGLAVNKRVYATDMTVTNTITGAVSGNAGSATAIAITDDTTTAATMYPTFTSNTTGNLGAKTSSSKLQFNPSSGVLMANNHMQGYATNSSTPITLSVSSAYQLYCTGSGNQQVNMPDTSTLVVGQQWQIVSKVPSTFAVTVKTTSGTNLLIILGPGASATLTCVSTVNNNASSWSVFCGQNITVSSTTPTWTPNVGDLWIDTA